MLPSAVRTSLSSGVRLGGLLPTVDPSEWLPPYPDMPHSPAGGRRTALASRLELLDAVE
ncbi:hypothetical protein [Kribbella sindirgiensis]|uniref:hypothetical protein n=1 Tax=Kribbella sindirgiensis TaxID=1124744 RepID=UPI00192D4D18|nr:hypothetical protein [Kribbella sindirgiensis]